MTDVFMRRAFRTVQRWTYCRRLSYNTASNKTRLSRTPGNRIVYLYTKKVGKAPKSASGVRPGRLRRIRAVRRQVLMSLSKTKKYVSRAYGGSMCAKCVRDRVKRAFLIGEQKTVEKVLKAQAQNQKGNTNLQSITEISDEMRKVLLDTRGKVILVTEDLAELCSVEWKVKFISNELGYLAEEISKQSTEGMSQCTNQCGGYKDECATVTIFKMVIDETNKELTGVGL
ncbi:PREDICTED: 60S ribosomal protein L34-like [Hipposideros armiger]|uniref:Large ribosomal subunit protein eL34 n=1 Tax=Hipposideros armiger TaxID=186990 RepID=A0A8B7RGW0_HIPAR|nr:PREDICTED: 60S ribosomal protein L34-like [Hipposideros armiger]